MRKGDDIYLKTKVSFAEAALGADITIPTMEGNSKLHVPMGIESGKKMRLKGKGFPSSSGKKGDLYAEIQIVPPKRITPEVEKILRELEETSKENPREGIGI